MPHNKLSGNTFNDISAIDARLAELDKEKQHLLAIKEALKKSQPGTSASESFSPAQKISIFRNLFRGRTDIFATRWQNQKGRNGTQHKWNLVTHLTNW